MAGVRILARLAHRSPVLAIEASRLGSDAGHHQPFLASGRSESMVLILRWALAAGLFSTLAFCVLGFLVTFESPSDRFCPCVYSVLIVLYGIGAARLIRPVTSRA
jgi:hypothetical protein